MRRARPASARARSPASPPARPPALPRVLVLHGPNLNLLGAREPHIYGRTTLAELDASLVALGAELGLSVTCAQSNHEGALVDLLHGALEPRHLGVVCNPGAYAHTSVALRDAIAALASMGVSTVEVHLTNTSAREPFRHASVTSGACLGRIEGLGPEGYALALRALASRRERTSA